MLRLGERNCGLGLGDPQVEPPAGILGLRPPRELCRERGESAPLLAHGGVVRPWQVAIANLEPHEGCVDRPISQERGEESLRDRLVPQARAPGMSTQRRSKCAAMM